MSKYKNKDGVELNYTGMDSHQVLVREVVSEAIRICNQYNWHDEVSMRWALERTKNFLEVNFDINTEIENRSDEWRIEQFNRHRDEKDQVSTIEELEGRVDEIFNS